MKDILQILKEANAGRAKHFPDYDKFEEGNILYYSNALAGETGELCNLVKKFYRGDKVTHGQLICFAIEDEVADILIQLDLFCQVAGVNLKDALINKFNSKSLEIGSNILL